MKEKKKVQASNAQLSIEFTKPLVNEKTFQVEMGKVIRLSGQGSIDNSKIDYSKLVIQNTKSF